MYCEKNLIFALNYKNETEKYTPKFLCARKYPNYYDGLDYEVLCAEIICASYDVRYLDNLYYVQRFPSVYYKEIEILINISKETDFYQIGPGDNGQEAFICIDYPCNHDEHSFRTCFELPAILHCTTPFLRHSFININLFRQQFQDIEDSECEEQIYQESLSSTFADPCYEIGKFFGINEYIKCFKSVLTNKIFLSFEYYDSMIDSIVRKMLTEYTLNCGSGNCGFNEGPLV